MDGNEEGLEFDPAEHPDHVEASPPNPDLGGTPVVADEDIDHLIPDATLDPPILED